MENQIWRSFAVGLTCGLRSMTGPAVVRWRAGDPLRLLFAALAGGELIADKLPGAPARTILPALAFRAASGGFSGRSVAATFNADRAAGLAAGMAGAVLATYAGLAVRSQISKGSGLPDALVAVVEDIIAIYGAAAATHP